MLRLVLLLLLGHQLLLGLLLPLGLIHLPGLLLLFGVLLCIGLLLLPVSLHLLLLPANTASVLRPELLWENKCWLDDEPSATECPGHKPRAIAFVIPPNA